MHTTTQAAEPASGSAPDLKEPRQRASYCIGLDIGSNMKKQKLDLDAKSLAAGIADALAGKPGLSAEEIRATLAEFQQKEMAKAEARATTAGAENAKAGEEFLATNSKKEGVKTTSTGLQYKSIKSGTGKSPKATDTVKVHYTGKLIDGTVFDSSVERNEPATFGVDQVIPGWTEVLQLMKEGDKWQVFIPSKLAYGERGAGPDIGPNSTLIFDVELLSIEAAK
ncbi:MAG: FKBP-type peptidyl-prolyl cis-trans isomerase [Verrucomicrobiales bacterium]|nr:FKBP-type peptidyl-prolyl cis-trans isomerase [Verrucomicrobiales bacterium]